MFRSVPSFPPRTSGPVLTPPLRLHAWAISRWRSGLRAHTFNPTRPRSPTLSGSPSAPRPHPCARSSHMLLPRRRRCGWNTRGRPSSGTSPPVSSSTSSQPPTLSP
eukprot:1543271-Rhodomonas_salina.1